MRVMIALAAFGVVAAAPAVAQVAAPAVASPADQAVKKADPSKKVICKVDREVGSMISQRTCMTRGEWDLLAADAKSAIDRRSRSVDVLKLPGG